MKKLSVVIFILAFVTLAVLLWYKEGTLAVSKTDTSIKTFIVGQGEGLNEIARRLELEGLIRNRIVFYLNVRRISEKGLQAGDFRLSAAMDVFQIIKELQHGTQDQWITVIEGLRKEEIAQIVSEEFKIPEVEFIKLAPEGYLFPDTYLIPAQATSETIISIMKGNFDKKYAALQPIAAQRKLTTNQVVTLASLIEREGKLLEDKRIIAGILLKRLKNDWPLQIDATIQYAIGYQSEGKTWWKKDLSLEDLKINSPYNSYKNAGLLPGPIGNPGLISLEAVVNADESTPYWYYVSDKNGRIHYAKTLEEHDANVKKYVR